MLNPGTFDMDFKMKIANLSTDELRELNAMVADILKLRQAHNSVVARSSFKVGDEVVMAATKRTKEEVGVITKINKTKAVVRVGAVLWNCPFSMLTIKN